MVTAILFVILAHICAAQEITVAAAADLQSAMQEIAADFQSKTGIAVHVTYGSSGNFFQQIENGAPFDLFFSANIDYPKKLESDGLTQAGSLYQYARGKLVAWAPNDSKINLNAGLTSLLDPRIKKIAIANPRHAPYGQAAVAALQKEGLYDKLKEKLVLGENISQTASFVIAGSADVGMIALSLALSPAMKDKGHYVEIPANDYSPIEQAGVILSSSKNQQAANKLLSYMKSPDARRVLVSYGFDVQPSDLKP
jgi:molybdate transport system substrate-binding protein